MDCKRFQICSANLCPLDKDLGLRAWIIGEEVCKNREFKDSPMIRRQKKLNRKQNAGLLGKLLTAEYLIETAPVKRKLTEEQRQKCIARLADYRAKNTHTGTLNGAQTLAFLDETKERYEETG